MAPHHCLSIFPRRTVAYSSGVIHGFNSLTGPSLEGGGVWGCDTPPIHGRSRQNSCTQSANSRPSRQKKNGGRRREKREEERKEEGREGKKKREKEKKERKKRRKERKKERRNERKKERNEEKGGKGGRKEKRQLTSHRVPTFRVHVIHELANLVGNISCVKQLARPINKSVLIIQQKSQI